MRHPNLLRAFGTSEHNRGLPGGLQRGQAKFTAIPRSHRTPQQVGDQLLTVTNAENRDTGRQISWVYGGAGVIVNAAGATGNNDAANARQFSTRNIARENSGGDAEFPNLAGNQVAVLATRVQYRDLSRGAYFFILSATIFLALTSKAWALGSALTAASTSGSTRIS